MQAASVVLVADDNPVDRLMIATAVRAAMPDGVTVLEAENAMEAAALMREHHPLMAIVDLIMPLGGGSRAARAAERMDVPCHVVTGTRPMSARADALASAKDDVPAAVAGWLREAEQEPPEPEEKPRRRSTLRWLVGALAG